LVALAIPGWARSRVKRTEFTDAPFDEGLQLRPVLGSDVDLHRATQIGVSVGKCAEDGLTGDDMKLGVTGNRSRCAYSVAQA
jgi:hypothetical protein